MVIHKTFYIPQRKLEERRARVGRLEDERAAAAAQAAARVVERAAEVVQEELAVLEEVEEKRLVPRRRVGTARTENCCAMCCAACMAAASALSAMYRPAATAVSSALSSGFLPSYVREKPCDESKPSFLLAQRATIGNCYYSEKCSSRKASRSRASGM